MKRRISTVIVYTVAFASFTGLLSSCSNPFIRLPDKRDHEKISIGDYAVVIVRIVSEADGKPYEVFASALPDGNYGLAVGTFETGGKAVERTPWFFSKKTKKDGWAYLLLEPGLQYLAVQPPRTTNVWDYAAMFEKAPLLRIDVPLKTPVVYIGTLHIPCVWKKVLFDKRLSFIEEKIDIQNEEDEARKITAVFLPEFGVPKTILMIRHQGPKIFRNPPNADIIKFLLKRDSKEMENEKTIQE